MRTMQLTRWFAIITTATLLAACSRESVVVTPPPPPPPAPEPEPLISLNNMAPVLKQRPKASGAEIGFTNTSAATYQYLLFRATAFDKNGNVVKPRKSLDERAYLRVPGPIMPGTVVDNHRWDNTWAGNKVACINVDQVEIIFEDGSIEMAQGKMLANATTSTCF